MIDSDWWECYGEGWKRLIVPEAVVHPAKYSRALIRRIYEHLLECRWVQAGDRVVDPFGGVALGAIDALRLGLRWTGVEIEEKFVALGQQNIAQWNARFNGMPHWGTADLRQGDSRELAKIVAGAECAVSSPPYAVNVVHGGSGLKEHPDNLKGQDYYGSSPLNLGNMREGAFEAAVSSPPYEGSVVGHGNEQDQDTSRRYDGFVSASGERLTPGRARGIKAMVEGYKSANPMNLGNGEGDTFWAAARTIVEQTYAVLRPGTHACWVVKSYVKAGKIVPFPERWQALCESVGFRTVHWHRAWLIEDRGSQHTLDGDLEKRQVKRASFFRLLAERKGAPPIDYEVVLCMVKE